MDNNFNQFDNQGGFPQTTTPPTPPTPPDLSANAGLEIPAINMGNANNSTIANGMMTNSTTPSMEMPSMAQQSTPTGNIPSQGMGGQNITNQPTPTQPVMPQSISQTNSEPQNSLTGLNNTNQNTLNSINSLNSTTPSTLSTNETNALNTTNNLNSGNMANTPSVNNQTNQTQTTPPTEGFVPNTPASNGKEKKKSKKPLIIGLAATLTVIILAIFIILPMVQKKFMSNPKNVFDTTIKNVSKNMNEFIADVNLESFLFDVNFKYDTNIESLKQFSGYTYGIKVGFNTKAELMEGSLYMNDSNNKNYGLNTYLKDQKSYMKLSNNDTLIYLGEQDQSELASTFEELNNFLQNKVSNSEISYLVEKTSSLMIDSIDEERLTKEDGTFKINDDEIDVTKNIYNINKETLNKTKEFIINGLVEDKKTLKTLAKLLEVEESEVKDSLTGDDDDTDNDVDDDINIDMIIYTEKKKNDVVGYELQENKQSVIRYAFNDNGFNLTLDSSDEEVDGIEVDEDAKQVVQVIGIKNGDKTNVDILYNDQKYVTLVVSQFDDKAIKFTYKISAEDVNVNGDFDLTMNNSNSGNDNKLALSLNSGSDKININLNLATKNNPKIADIDVSNAKELSEEELDKVLNDFIVSLNDTPVGYLFSTTGGLVDKDTYDQYDDLEM